MNRKGKICWSLEAAMGWANSDVRKDGTEKTHGVGVNDKAAIRSKSE